MILRWLDVGFFVTVQWESHKFVVMTDFLLEESQGSSWLGLQVAASKNVSENKNTGKASRKDSVLVKTTATEREW